MLLCNILPGFLHPHLHIIYQIILITSLLRYSNLLIIKKQINLNCLVCCLAYFCYLAYYFAYSLACSYYLDCYLTHFCCLAYYLVYYCYLVYCLTYGCSLACCKYSMDQVIQIQIIANQQCIGNNNISSNFFCFSYFSYFSYAKNFSLTSLFNSSYQNFLVIYCS